MAAPNLTREQAKQRAGLLSVQSYAIELDVTNGAGQPGNSTFRSATTVRFTSKEVAAASWIDLIAASIHRAVLNGVELDVSGYREDDGIVLPNLAEHNELVVEADCRYMNTGEGLHRFVDPVDDNVYLYSKFEPVDAKRMFTCFDQPDLKATYDITVIAPANWKIISNESIKSTKQLFNGAVRHEFNTTQIISTYVVAVVAGPYAEWRDSHDGIPLGLYCRASLAEHMDAERIFTQTKQGFNFYHRSFEVRYPFGKYDQCFVPEFNTGAMENAGCVTIRDEYVWRSKVIRYRYERRCETFLHELAHMWFGDLVTMQWWDDLWLNESFASWAGVLASAEATEYTRAWSTFASIKKSWAYMQDQLPSTHPIAADIPDVQAVTVNFDGITYAKGASVLKQLVAYVGLDKFFAGLKIYFTKHAWGNATLSDLLAALEDSSGRDLSQWSKQWLETTGLNIIRPSFQVDNEGNFTEFAILQEPAKPGAGELRTHRLAIGIYDFDAASGKLIRTHRIEVDITGERTNVPKLIGIPRGKLILTNDDDLTYCALRLDQDSLHILVDHIADIADPLARTLCWSSAWEMTRDAEFKARDYINLVLNGIQTETESGVILRLLTQVKRTLESYADPVWAQEQGWPEYTDRLLELALNAEPGSDHQLAFINALTESVLNPEKLTLIRNWLTNVDVLDGLIIDTDLRWKVLLALVAHGVASTTEIEAELQRDNTATGREEAEHAFALLPNKAAKAEAWKRVIFNGELSNATAKAIAIGFSHPVQEKLLTEYIDKYFADIAEFWSRHTIKRAEPTAFWLFPSWAIKRSTVDRAEQWLAGDHPPALRRVIIEGQAAVVRALKAREFNRSGE